MQELHPRLKAAADMVAPGRVVADIGTDHAYLPAYLLLNGISPYVIACDIGEKPLRNAAETVAVYHLAGKINNIGHSGCSQTNSSVYKPAYTFIRHSQS